MLRPAHPNRLLLSLGFPFREIIIKSRRQTTIIVFIVVFIDQYNDSIINIFVTFQISSIIILYDRARNKIINICLPACVKKDFAKRMHTGPPFQ